jgi:penicillin-binding protein 1B
LAERIKAMGKAGNDLQGAVVLSHARSGAVEAVVGGRQGDAQGFNRALDARRPIGSLVKPFVYLVALAQPQEWSLMSPLSDRALNLRLPNGQTWTPSNIDGVEHGDVALIDALARSYNLATVHLGLALDVRKVARVLEALIPGTRVEPHPSLLLGATDLAPFQVAQAYQYLAADGRPMALYGLEAVLDASGNSLTRHGATPTPGDLVAASRLVGFALQETARHGTAHALVGLGLGHLNAAGKTGTSNEQRDSWFAGYTGTHLAVVWLGTDDNRKTNLFGATGALRVWAGLFGKLPTEPLRLDFTEDPQLAWVDPMAQAQTEETCEGARQLPFVAGHAPMAFENCRMQHFSDWFDGRDDLARDASQADPVRGEDEYTARAHTAERERQAMLRVERERERELARERRRERWRRWFGRDDDET